jgi:hypothetical protein
MPLTLRPEPTPNPNAMRIALSAPLLGEKATTYAAPLPPTAPAWAGRLLETPGVASLFGLRDFLTVTKAPSASWDLLLPKVLAVLSEELR